MAIYYSMPDARDLKMHDTVMRTRYSAPDGPLIGCKMCYSVIECKNALQYILRQYIVVIDVMWCKNAQYILYTERVLVQNELQYIHGDDLVQKCTIPQWQYVTVHQMGTWLSANALQYILRQ